MPLQIIRYNKAGGALVQVDTAATVNVSKATFVRRQSNIIVPIPGEQHFGMPMGPEATEFTATFPWDMTNPPASGTLYKDSLKRWTTNSVYGITPTGSLTNDITTGHYLAKSIVHSRKAPGVRGAPGNVFKSRWEVTMNFIKLRASDVTDCPTFYDVTLSNSYGGASTVPYFKMTNVLDSSYVETLLSSVKVSHTGSGQAFALYDEEALTILPPLGNTGPVIDIEFRVSSNTNFNTIKDWAKTRSLVVAVDQRHYDEFDIDNPTSYYSRWMVGGISWDREATSGAAYATDSSKINRKITMTLTRYWGYELVEV